MINEFPLLETNITTHAADIDVRSAYPTEGSILNISKGTSLIEVCNMDDVGEVDRRSVGINLTAAKINALEICQHAYGFPKPEALLAKFLEGG